MLYRNPAHSPKRRAEYRKRNRDVIHAYDRQWRRALKLEVFNAYGGPYCALCPETRLGALHLDHISQNGASHRRSIGIRVGPLYRWVKSNGFPDGFRVLCSNCNFLAYWLSRPSQLSENKSARSKRKRAIEIKAEFMARLGGACGDCGTTDLRVLSAHHPMRDGRAHRRTISAGRGSHRFYAAILKSGCFQNIQCLCMSCNDAVECERSGKLL